MANGQVEGIPVTGEQVKNLQDKKFTIIEPAPYYTEVPSFQDKNAKVRKLHVTVRLANGDEAEWLPNMTSIKSITARAGLQLVKWVGFTGEFMTASQKVGDGFKDVIYVK